MILAIDIGTTRTHMAVIDIDKLSYADRMDFDNLVFDERFAAAVQKILLKYDNIRKASIASCVKELLARAQRVCASRFDDVRSVTAHEKLPVAFQYENRSKLGADRVCNALACAKLFKDQSCIIIDSGTAITVDYLRDGKTFEGGMIFPGCAMQINALHNIADALPFVLLRGDEKNNVTLPSTSTEKCIKAGILYGSAGAIERCVTEYLRLHASIAGNANKIRVIATGGGWEVVEPFVNINREIPFIPDLTLFGAAVYHSFAFGK